MALSMQSAKGTMSELGKSALGNSKKAVLILHKQPMSGDDPSGADSVMSDTMEALGRVGASAGAHDISKSLKDGYHVMQVQYNPSSITFQANAQAVSVQYLQKNIDSSVPNQNSRMASIVMSVELIFDAVNNKDAFMTDKFRLSANDMVSAGAAVKQSRQGGYTVKPQTNGLIGMIMRNSTRMVTFHWADLSFFGEVTEVQARYTMFSVSGKPIRSVVRLNISQRISENAGKGGAQDQYWNERFDHCFQSDHASGKSLLEKAGNLVNVRF